MVGGLLSPYVDGKLLEDEFGDWNRPLFVVLRRRLLKVAVHFDHGAVHLEATPNEIDVSHTKSRQFTPPQPCIGEHENKQSEAFARGLGVDSFRERDDLLVREEILAILDLLGQLQP